MQAEREIVIASTFTAEPVRESVQFWLERMQMPGRISFAPQNQVIQTLLDPTSAFNLNTGGINVVLLRWEDLDGVENSEDDRPIHDLVEALSVCTAKAKVPHLLITCPASSLAPAKFRRPLYEEWENRLTDEFAANPKICMVRSDMLQALYPSASVYDAYGDRLALMPYSPAASAVIGTMIARKFHVLTTEPYKAIVIDCDGTLWNGACGEDGPYGVRVEEPHLAIQRFLASQWRQGVLICLCSKNNEEDVAAVFQQRADMMLVREHLAASRISWAPKPENLLSIAEELGLALESFVFLDNDPVECETMRQSLPDVLTLQVPADHSDIPGWLRRVWAFDRPNPTEEDRKRTALYRQESGRQQLRKRSTTLEEFLAGLELKIKCIPLDACNTSRASQLTFRVNQFNLTGIRRTEAELITLLREDGFHGFAIEVSDRFGDYGLVGLILYSSTQDALQVDTFLLSCRALGRRVEHQILAELAMVAKRLGLSAIEFRVNATGKNQPARDFLETNLGAYRQQHGQEANYRVPIDVALARCEHPGSVRERSAELHPNVPVAAIDQVGFSADRAQRLAWIASEMIDADRILAAIQDWKRRDRRDEKTRLVPPSTELERLLANVWAEVVGLKEVGVRDNFFSLGGDSLMMVRIIIKLYGLIGIEFPISVFFESPTIREQAIKFSHLISPSDR
jgi:FkbH-like protein